MLDWSSDKGQKLSAALQGASQTVISIRCVEYFMQCMAPWYLGSVCVYVYVCVILKRTLNLRTR